MRQNFLDTASFQATVTDRNGKANVTLQLPDNLTSWRVSAIAYDQKVQAGDATTSLRATLPFFLNPVINSQYLSADDISLSLRAAGTAIDPKATIAYTLQVQGNGKEIKKNYNGKSGDFTFCNLGKLPLGEYTLTISGRSGNYSDTMEQKIQVVESLKEIPMSKTLTSETISALKPSRYPVQLLLFDQENALYFQALGNLIGQTGNRAEQRLARVIAESKLQSFYTEATNAPDKISKDILSDLQDWDGGIRLLPYGESDPELTAWVCTIGADYISQEKAGEYLDQLRQNPAATQREVAYAYMGLAALKKPVLLDLRQLLSQSSDWVLEDQMTLALGLSLAGDQKGAQAWYQQHIAPLIKTTEQWKQLEGTDGYALTAKATALSISCHQEDRIGLLQYLLDHPSTERLTTRELLLYVTQYQPAAAKETSFVYNINDKTISGDFTKEPLKILYLNQGELADFHLKTSAGSLGIIARYTGNATDLINTGDQVTITKQYANTIALDSNTSKVTLKVHFAEDAPLGWYTLSDVVPTGARFIKPSYSETQPYFFYQQELQQLQFVVFRSEKKDGSKTKDVTVTYNIRGILPGHYKVESAIIQYDGTPINAYSKEGTVTIGE